ncbi:carbohydrate ABC transporter permease [Bacillota bacterium Meth-B3]|nr:sugar ABC transporter permease [Christensenellaceae bacterium]MEA5066375.1 sugar ABC transporter permease [Eubacteriales bacterium]MEA5068723.1 sugar ABC transporter permease [Christensenellaceae bacterium]
MTAKSYTALGRGGGSINPSGGYWMRYILPALTVYLVFMAYPLLDSVRLSLYSGTTGAREFVGFANYVRLFTDPVVSLRFWTAFKNTWVFFAYHMILQNALGILFAVILTNRTMRGRSFYQAVIFIPCTIAVLVTGYLFKLMLNPIWAGATLKKIGLGFLVRSWLGETGTALSVVSLVSVWQWVGIPTMMFVAGFQNISDDLIEAASIEGANTWQQFTRIKLPLILPVVGMIAVLTFVANFNAFDAVYSMETPDGAPNYTTDLIGTLFYRYGVAGQHPVGIPEPGVGAAIATSVFAMLLLGVIPTLSLTQGRE